MSVTIEEIAEVCKVSRGTVDRVLHNRGRVKKETKELVEKTAKELGYRPNTAGKALAARKKKYGIGIILSSEGIEFYEDVRKGIEDAKRELEDYGVQIFIQTMRGYSVEKQIDYIEKMSIKVQCFIINGINDERIIKKVKELKERKIAVITLNTDIESSERLCYVGCDYIQSGKTAAGIMSLLTGQKAQIGIAAGSVKILGHNQRVQGFIRLCKEVYPQMEIADIVETKDEEEYAYRQTRQMLLQYPNITAIYIVAAGTKGVCRAIEERKRETQIQVVACDNTISVREGMKKGIIKASVCQEPWVQGYRSVWIAVEYLVKGIIPEDNFLAKNEIKILENIDDK